MTKPARTETPTRDMPDAAPPNTGLTVAEPLLDPRTEETLTALDSKASRFALAIQAETAVLLRRDILQAKAIKVLRQCIDEKVMEAAITLMNTPMGFLTDRPNNKNPNEYSPKEVKEILIWALLNGFRWSGNEFNIISGKGYGAKDGFIRKFREIPGISDIRLAPGIPRLIEGQQVVRMRLSWFRDGKRAELIGPDGKPGQPFAAGGTMDAAIGKATRKAYKLAYEQVTGSLQTVEDGEVGDPVERALPGSASDRVAARLAAAPGGDPAAMQRIGERLVSLKVEYETFHDWCRDHDANHELLTSEQAEKCLAWLDDVEVRQREEAGERDGMALPTQ